MTQTKQLWTVNAIKDAVRATGSHWFDPDTMRSFKCRVGDTVYQGPGGIYFVTSEKGPHGPRGYTVRQFIPAKSDISTVGEFCVYGKSAAVGRAKRLAASSLQSQWLEAIRALDQATTGADLGRTFDADRNYVKALAALDGEIVHFPGDGGYTRCQAKRYSDGSGVYLELIQTGATPRQEAWSAAYKLQQEACRVLSTLAAGAYTEGERADSIPGLGRLVPEAEGGLPAALRPFKAVEATETFRPVSVREQFLLDLQRHGNSAANEDDARDLIRLAAAHQKMMENRCNIPNIDDAYYDADGNEIGPLLANQEKIKKLAKDIGASAVIFSGDPRGATVKLTFADGETNDFGKEGWIVPTELNP